MTREEAVQALHKVIREHWCDEFEYGESCKHCSLEITLCEPLFKAMYPDFFKDAITPVEQYEGRSQSSGGKANG